MFRRSSGIFRPHSLLGNYTTPSFLPRAAELLSRTIGLHASQLFPSPSKFYLLRKLVICLGQSAGMEVGLDTACTDFKYRELFKTRRYVGIDLEPASLNQGLALRARPPDVGVLADLLDLERVPGVANVVVLTHPRKPAFGSVGTRRASPCGNGGGQRNALPELAGSIRQQRVGPKSSGSIRHGDRTVYGAPLFMGIDDFFARRTGSKNPFVLVALGTSIVLRYLLSFLEEIAWVRKRR